MTPMESIYFCNFYFVARETVNFRNYFEYWLN